ncbi:MAG: 4Fe-4S binding protein, partial [Planctomycetaceae bacterium]|nr:4Fe-4S binding protein [Planctomycetaceae bacterium]
RRLEETQETASGSESENPVYSFVTLRNISTTLITAIGVLIGTTGLRGKRRLRWSFQIILIVWLGLVNGDLLSQASLLGWSQNGIPWQRAAGLVILTLAAVIVPIVSRRNVYCSHICPHGAVQQLLRNRLPWKLSISGKIQRRLRLIPVILITWVMLVGFLHLPFSPVDIEPFDAWLFSIAGTATIIVAIGGLVASALTPMAYCRFGCPTGALLDFLTRSRRSDWQLQDTFALILLAAAIVLQMTV